MSYLKLAEKLGQSVERLKAGEVIRTSVRVNSLAEFKELFGANLDTHQREAHSRDLAAQHKEALASQAPEHLMLRLGDYVHGSGELSASDAAAASRMFPITVHVESGADYVLRTDVTYGPSAPPVLLNYGTLTFAGGSITTLNTVLTLNADTITFTDATGNKNYQIGILGVDGDQGNTGAPGTSTPGQAATGKNSSPSSPGVCTGAGGGGTGATGANGGDGQTGGSGGTGKPSLQANITFNNFVNPNGERLVLYTRSGGGGKGGTGGRGGDGQQGGNGGHGCDSGCEGTDGGKGGDGGIGGKGGDGGLGGNGVNGNNIFVTGPAAALEFLVKTSDVAPYGQGGEPGLGGTGGVGGRGGRGGKHASNGGGGGSKSGGNPGAAGKPGTIQGNPGTFYFNGR